MNMAHTMFAAIAVSATICQGHASIRSGAMGWDMNMGQLPHSTARSQHHLMFSSSVRSVGFHISSCPDLIIRFPHRQEPASGTGGEYHIRRGRPREPRNTVVCSYMPKTKNRRKRAKGRSRRHGRGDGTSSSYLKVTYARARPSTPGNESPVGLLPFQRVLMVVWAIVCLTA
jgi:hypothetical protein